MGPYCRTGLSVHRLNATKIAFLFLSAAYVLTNGVRKPTVSVKVMTLGDCSRSNRENRRSAG